VHTTSEERADALDAHLWTYRDDSFLPHATWRAEDASEQPILLTIDGHNPNRATVMFLIDNAPLPDSPEAYERLVLVFDGDDAAALEATRAIWTGCRSRGFEVTYWRVDENGRWQRRQ
jgi:DNA polymerase-3 subunit chi